MKKRVLSLLLSLALLLTLPMEVWAAHGKIDQEVFEQAGSYYNVLVEFHGQAPKASPGLTKVERRAQTIDHLQELAQASQKRALDLLRTSDQVRSYESFYIINAIQVEAKKPVIKQLAGLAEVRRIYTNTTEFKMEDRGQDQKGGFRSWNLEASNVTRAWEEFSSQGEGVVIGFIDSGVSFDHEALRASWRGNQASGLLEKKGNWYDLVDPTTNFPVDEYGHGTAIAGVALGEKEEGPLGVAPAAQWIAVRAFSGENANNESILRAAQWMLEPEGDPAKAPDIINNSWGGKSSATPWFNRMLDAWIEAGIFPVFSAGNGKRGQVTGLGTIDNPASLKEAFAVGAIDASLKVSTYSKKGPSSFAPELIKPEVVAPGAKILTAKNTGGYTRWSGTSIAAPHISGIAALLLSINQDLTPADLRTILIQSARGLTDTDYPQSPNMAYGYGMVDALKACQLAREYKGNSLPDLARIAGANRYETSLNIARTMFDQADTVYLANGHQFTDGLTMGSLSKDQPGPLLLMGPNLDQATIQLIQDLGAKKVVIIGGNRSVSEEIEARLRDTFAQVDRIAGANRYETAASIASHLVSKEEVFLVNSRIDADAISIAGIAAKKGQPVLLATQDQLPEESRRFIVDQGVKKITLIGGVNQLGPGLVQELEAMDLELERLAGKDRYATGALINGKYQLDAREVFFANGVNTADALAISPVIAQGARAIQITRPNQLTGEISSFLKQVKADKYYLLGGERSLNRSLEYELLNN